MLNFKKLASTLIFSLFAFQSTAFAVPRYAKVVLLGGKGSGKTTIQKLINKDYDIENIPHTTQISYISVPVFYDNKGNFTFDEDRDIQRYNKEVILNICDTPSIDLKEEEKEELDIHLDYSYDEEDEVINFAKKRPNVLVFLANEKECDFHGANLVGDCSFIKCLLASSNLDARKLIVVTNSCANKPPMMYHYLKAADDNDDELDTVKVLTLFDSKAKEENKKIGNNKIDNKYEEKFANKKENINIISKEISLEYIAKTREFFNKNSKEDLKKYVDIILNSIARSVYKYGINNLPLDNNASDWSIIDGKLTKGH